MSISDEMDNYSIQDAQDDIATLKGQMLQIAEFFSAAMDPAIGDSASGNTGIALGMPPGLVKRGPVSYNFDDGTTQGWTGTSCTPSNSTFASTDATWPSTGTESLLLTTSVGGVAWSAVSPQNLIAPGDGIAVTVDLYAPVAMSKAYIGIQYFNEGGGLISETDYADTALTAGTSATFQLTDQAPGVAETGASDDAWAYAIVVGSHGTEAINFQLYVDNVYIPGNLAFATSVGGGTDELGNPYRQGQHTIGTPGLTSADVVTDPFGNVLSSLDSSGNHSAQNYNAAGDISLQGTSLLDLFGMEPSGPSVNSGPLGIQAYGVVPAANIPTAASAGQFLEELDCQVYGTRTYRITVTGLYVTASTAGAYVTATIYFTTDGTQPSTSSTILCQTFNTIPGSSNRPLPDMSRIWRPGTETVRMRLYLQCNTGTCNLVSGVPNADAAAIVVEDIGPNIANTGIYQGGGAGGTSGGSQTYTKTYTCSHTYSYEGNGGPSPNTKINSGGACVYGGNGGITYHYRAKSWIVLPYSQIQSDTSGATINWCKVYLNNNHTWYNNGGKCGIGFDTKTSFGATAADPSGTHIDDTDVFFSEGQAKWCSYLGLGQALQGGTAYNVVLYKASTALQYYGYMAGRNQSGPPQVQINYTK